MNFLIIFEWVYLVAVKLRNFFYAVGILPVRRLPGRVISVGNIALGGTGKSPIVQDIARKLIMAGNKPVILTRGYKSGLKSHEWQVLLNGRVVAGTDRIGVVADEAMMQSSALSGVYVVVGARRYVAAQEFLKINPISQPTHWVLDDGFQHRHIHRDVDVLVLDARNPWGRCLPVGPFREPKSSLARATAIVLTKSQDEIQILDARSQIAALNIHPSIYEVRFFLGDLRLACGDPVNTDETYALICSVAQPNDVKNSLESKGVRLSQVYAYPDHSNFIVDDILRVRGRFQRIVTTEKDWARDRSGFESLGIPVFVAPLGLEWVGGTPEFLSK